ncbi:MAG: endolytic transglycosylase MltG [Pseudomonadota bacterium]
MKTVVSYVLMLLIILGLLVSASTFLYLVTPPGPLRIPKIIDIQPGATFPEVAEILQKEGIIKDIGKFSLLVRYHRVATKIKAGEYSLNTSMLPVEVLDTLVKGKVTEHSVTIPEGYNVYQVADLLDGARLVNRHRLLEKCFDRSFISRLGVEGDSLEGYLFPDTYKISRYMGEEDVLGKMVAQFKKVYGHQYAKRAKKLGLTVKEVVTLASLVEKETGQPWERPLISAVFQNRLKRGIRLQSDPTAVYGIADFSGKITSKHLKRRTPYNTYLHSGLPPGPIANPGLESIKAVLYPANVDYFYFVSKDDGTHHFSGGLREHNRAVLKYQKRKR